jgi:hypothetical protein
MKKKILSYFADILLAAAFAAVVAVFAVGAGQTVDGQISGAAREILAGSTVGRQALFGSCWHAPLMTLFYLPFAWLLPGVWAAGGACFAAWLVVLLSCKTALFPQGGTVRLALVQAGISGMAVVGRNAGACEMNVALAAGLAVLAGASLANWAALRQIRFVVQGGIAAALLLLCGAAFFVPVVVALLAVLLLACGKAETRGRLQAWLLLGWSPVVYAAGVWLLLNRLILGDAFFFIRSLPSVFSLKWGICAAAYLPVFVIVWILDKRSTEKGAGLAAANVAMFCWGVLLAGLSSFLGRSNVTWAVVPLAFGALATLLVASGRLRQPPYRLAVVVVLFIVAIRFWLPHQAMAAQPVAKACEAVEQHVDAATKYGRVFVVGYRGLELLRDYRGERLTPNMDLHITSLRQAYKGQDLYVLVPKPVGLARTESVFWRYPQLFERGAERLLFDRDFGDWRLFQVVAAPTQEQLDEWRGK